MIRIIKFYDECREFASGFQGDPNFSDPMLCNEEQIQGNLIKSINIPDRHCVLGIYSEDQMIGLFAFLVLRDEQYIEMLVGLSRDKEAYLEVLQSAKTCNPEQKKIKADTYRDGLLSQGGPATDGFLQAWGKEKTADLFKNVVFG
jgi:hypothetical protein